MNLNFPKEFKREFVEFSFTKHISDPYLDTFDYLFEMEKITNQKLQIKNYSDVITQIIVVFIKTRFGTLTNDSISLLRKTKALEIGLNLNNDNIDNFTQQQINDLMIKKYLTSIQTLLAKRKDFDHKKFYQDNVKLFEV